MAISRRGFLIGGAAVVGVAAVGVVGGGVLVEEGVLPGKSKLDEALGRCGTALQPPDVEPGPVVSGSFVSKARSGTEVGWTVIYPPGTGPGAALPVCLFLHGRGGSHTDATGPMELPGSWPAQSPTGWRRSSSPRSTEVMPSTGTPVPTATTR